MTTEQGLVEDTTLAAEPKPDTEPETEPETRTKPETRTEAESEPETWAETEPETRAEEQAEARTKERADERAEEPAKEQAQARAEERAEVQARAEERAEVQARAEERAEVQAEASEAEGGAGRTVGAKGARWRGVAVGAVLALVLAATGGAAVVQWLTADRLQGQLAPLEHDRQLRLEVSGAAGAFATTLLSYDYKDLQTTRGQVIAMTAGNFLATYDEAFGGPMEQVIIKLEAVSKATVREVYLSEVDEVSAKALISVDQQVTSKEAVRNVLGTHLKLVMIKQKGVWKVSDVTVLGAAKETETKLGKDD
ncbi:hypothetical protein [Nonomuraea dietziae]|uniref:hypothetical protein n=1 Tax=Nonomuraea dietziae TaxID=65515 RepID=UPI0033F257C9